MTNPLSEVEVGRLPGLGLTDLWALYLYFIVCVDATQSGLEFMHSEEFLTFTSLGPMVW